MITCSPPRFALQPSRVIDASSHLLFPAAGILPSLLAILGVACPRLRGQIGESSGAGWLLLAGQGRVVSRASIYRHLGGSGHLGLRQ
jgi:hypothetical protein